MSLTRELSLGRGDTVVIYWTSSSCNGYVSVNHFCSQCSMM